MPPPIKRKERRVHGRLANTKAKLALYKKSVKRTARAVTAVDAAEVHATIARASAAAAEGNLQAAKATAIATQAALGRANDLLARLNRSVYQEETKMHKRRAARPTALSPQAPRRRSWSRSCPRRSPSRTPRRASYPSAVPHGGAFSLGLNGRPQAEGPRVTPPFPC